MGTSTFKGSVGGLWCVRGWEQDALRSRLSLPGISGFASAQVLMGRARKLGKAGSRSLAQGQLASRRRMVRRPSCPASGPAVDSPLEVG